MTQVTAPKDEPSAAPSEVAEGVDPPAVSAQLDATPQKESNLPQDAPKEVCDSHSASQVLFCHVLHGCQRKFGL